jgi:hypothetical protein
VAQPAGGPFKHRLSHKDASAERVRQLFLFLQAREVCATSSTAFLPHHYTTAFPLLSPPSPTAAHPNTQTVVACHPRSALLLPLAWPWQLPAARQARGIPSSIHRQQQPASAAAATEDADRLAGASRLSPETGAA